jgi:hypothetical protein
MKVIFSLGGEHTATAHIPVINIFPFSPLHRAYLNLLFIRSFISMPSPYQQLQDSDSASHHESTSPETGSYQNQVSHHTSPEAESDSVSVISTQSEVGGAGTVSSIINVANTIIGSGMLALVHIQLCL